MSGVSSISGFILFIINAAIAVGMYTFLNGQKNSKLVPPDAIPNLGVLGLTWFALSIIYGLILTFDALEGSLNASVSRAFIDGFAASMRVMLAGLLLICLPLFIYLKVAASSPKRRVS